MELVKARIHVASLFPGFVRLDQQSLALGLADGIARGTQRSVQHRWHQREQCGQGQLQGCLRIDSVPTWLALRESEGDRTCTDLFTF